MDAPMITPTFPRLADQKDGEEVRKSLLDLAQKINEVVISERRRVDNIVNSADDPFFILYQDADAHVFPLPENAPLKTTYSIMRNVASTNQISVSTSGGDTVEGSTSFVTHGATETATLNTQIVQITKTSATEWSFTGGVVSGYVSGRGWYMMFGDGTMVQWFISQNGINNLSNFNIGAYGWSAITGEVTVTFPIPFYDFPSGGGSGGYILSYLVLNSVSTMVIGKFDYTSRTVLVPWVIFGRWKA